MPGIDLVIVHGAEESAREALGGESWASSLAEALRADVVDLTAPGASNRHLVRTVVAGTSALIRSRGFDRERVLAALVWTSVDRFEIQTRRAWPSLASRSESTIQLTRPLAAAGDRRSQAWYQMYHADFGSTELMLFTVLLERWFASEGVAMANVLGPGVGIPADEHYDCYRKQLLGRLITTDGLLGRGTEAGRVRPPPESGPGTGGMLIEQLLPRFNESQERHHPPRRSLHPSRVRLVVVNGDSNTWGDEHADPASSCWGSVLADRLGADVVNLADRGGSNHRLLRTTVAHLGRVVRQHEVAPHEVLFVGMWTMTHRFEMTEDEQSPSSVRESEVNEGSWHRIFPARIESGHLRSKVWYQDLDGDRQGVVDLLLWTILLDRWLKDFGCRHLLALAYDVLPESTRTLWPELVAQLPEKVLAGGTQWSELALRSIFKGRSPHGPHGHLLEEGHRRYVEDYLLPWLQQADQIE